MGAFQDFGEGFTKPRGGDFLAGLAVLAPIVSGIRGMFTGSGKRAEERIRKKMAAMQAKRDARRDWEMKNKQFALERDRKLRSASMGGGAGLNKSGMYLNPNLLKTKVGV